MMICDRRANPSTETRYEPRSFSSSERGSLFHDEKNSIESLFLPISTELFLDISHNTIE